MTYLAHKVLAAIHILDTLVSQKRSRAATSSGNQPHPFLRDQPRHRPLPKHRGKSIRILKALVDVDWLAMNPMYDLPAFIADENIDEADEDMQVIQSHVTDSRMNGKELGCESDSSGMLSFRQWIITHFVFQRSLPAKTMMELMTESPDLGRIEKCKHRKKKRITRIERCQAQDKDKWNHRVLLLITSIFPETQ